MSLTRFLLPVLFVLAASGGAGAEYVFFHQVIGDWAVICSRSGAGKNGCQLTGPPPTVAQLGAPGLGAPPSRITVTGNERSPRVRLRIFSRMDDAALVRLAVEGEGTIKAEINRYGEALWTGSGAEDLIEDFAGGEGIVLSYRKADGREQKETIGLGGFKAALATWQARTKALRP